MTSAPADTTVQERGVAALDALDRDTLVEILFHSCHLALRDWAHRVAEAAPFGRLAVLLEVAAAEVHRLSQAELVEAHSGLKPLGERRDDSTADARWSRGEAAGVGRDEQYLAELREANAAYLSRFGHVFLINATGMSGEQILGALRRRTAHDDAAETAEIKVELTKLVQLRLTKLTAELGAGASAGDLLAGL